MSRSKGSVRIGPISLFTLMTVLCLAVLGVLSISTAQATYAAAEKQAAFTADTYVNESAAQNLLANVDETLASVRKAGGSLDAALVAVDGMLPSNAKREGTTVSAKFSTESGRALDIELTVRANATYEITAGKATTQWPNASSGETLWSGAAQTR